MPEIGGEESLSPKLTSPSSDEVAKKAQLVYKKEKKEAPKETRLTGFEARDKDLGVHQKKSIMTKQSKRPTIQPIPLPSLGAPVPQSLNVLPQPAPIKSGLTDSPAKLVAHQKPCKGSTIDKNFCQEKFRNRYRR